MASNRELRRRIITATNIAKITRAMEMVAASKMKRAQTAALAGISYEQLMKKMVANIIRFSHPADHALLFGRKDTAYLPSLVIVITPDRGLCGSLPYSVIRLAEQSISADSSIVAVGKKTVSYFKKTNLKVIAEFEKLGDKPSFADISPIGIVALKEYMEKRVSRVQVVYPRFINTLSQQPTAVQILPFSHLSDTEGVTMLRPKYIFEPSKYSLLECLLPAFLLLTIYQAVLSGKAAEQSARMISMKHASENALDVKKFLELQYNQNRQKAITSEIADIVTATLAEIKGA